MRTKSSIKITASDSSVLLTLGGEIRDHHWWANGQRFQDEIRLKATRKVTVDMSETTWFDPAPLLDLLVLVGEHRHKGGEVFVNLGSPRFQNDNRFLIFLARHGFLFQVLKFATAYWDGVVYADTDTRALALRLRTLPGTPLFQNANCIDATVLSVSDLEPAALDRLVEKLVSQADRYVKAWLGATHLSRGLLLHRVRVILYEALDNIREHAYPGVAPGIVFGAVYARIRAGLPANDPELREWHAGRGREAIYCPTLKKNNVGRRPGWIELILVDAGVGITHCFPSADRNPLLKLSGKLFRDPVSRLSDREAVGKTGVTGLQQIGELLRAQRDDEERGSFVRICSNGEWVGDHLPWPDGRSIAGHENYSVRTTAHPPSGTVLHFAFEPPAAAAFEQRSYYPASFVVPTASDLAIVRKALGGGATQIANHVFVDQFQREARYGELRRDLLSVSAGTASIIIIRPSRAMRKRELVAHIKGMAERTGVPIMNIIFVDVPPAAAIDYSLVLSGERRLSWRPKPDLRVIFLAQDWSCAAYEFDRELGGFAPRPGMARAFISANPDSASAALAGLVLRDQDSILFWSDVGDAYLNELVLWSRGKDEEPGQQQAIFGYLDVSLALSGNQPFETARRALRRAIASFAHQTVYPSDDLVRSIIARDFDVASPHSSASKEIIIAGSVRGTGNTVRRFAEGGTDDVVGIAFLVAHPDLPSEDAAITEVVALRWIPPARRRKKKAILFERIPHSPFIIRGGERAIPLPRFRTPTEGRLGDSLYGESPGNAYRRWQRLDLLRFGHWVYNRHHDLLTVSLADALEFDAAEGAPIIAWFVEQISKRRAVAPDQKIIITYPQHAVAERLVRLIVRRLGEAAPPVFPLAIPRSSLRSPAMISPMARELLARLLKDEFKRGGEVILIDDGIITGATMLQLSQAIEGVWDTLIPAGMGRPKAGFSVCSIALIDRSGVPMERSLVERSVERNPRFWRWDVPTLGSEGSCPLCSALARFSDLHPLLQAASLERRLHDWEDIWRAVPVGGARFDFGVPPRAFPEGDHTRFCVEDGADSPVFDQINHLVSTSRIAVAAEIVRSTTRKDYPLTKARFGLHKDGSPFDITTRMELLCSQLLLFLEDLSPADVLDRQRLLMELLWSANEATASSALAALTLVAARNSAPKLWGRCVELVDNGGFPTDDALLTAIGLYQLAKRPPLPLSTHAYWTMFQLAHNPGERFKEPISRVLRVFGWSPESLHRSPISDLLLDKGEITRQGLAQLNLLLTGLANALESLHLDISAGALSPSEDAKLVRHYAKQLEAVGLGKGRAVDNPVKAIIYSEQGKIVDPQLRTRVSDISVGALARIFGTDGLQARYNRELTAKIAPDGAFLLPVLGLLDRSWSATLAKHDDRKLLWADEKPAIYFVDGDLGSKETFVYFDPTVRRAVMEVLSNVVHRNAMIPCPWGGREASLLADMWGRISIDASAGMLEMTLVNSAAGNAVPRAHCTMPIAHLENLGGSVAYHRNGGLFYADLRIPLVSTIATIGQQR